MTTRRGFLAGLVAAGALPTSGWADAGAPDYLAAALFPDGSYRLAGLRASGDMVFDLPLPGRGHAAAAHPSRPEAVAFARRPGRFALVIDCRTGQPIATLDAPEGRHFYGHGVFSRDGRMLFTTENDYDAGQGMIGLWDATRGYARIGEMFSGGVGPHDMVLMPDGETLAVANGGIETHPETGRAQLNLPFMAPNLTYMELDGGIEEQVTPPPGLHRNSIRHLALRGDGLLGFTMQWQGDVTTHPPLLGLHRRGSDPVFLAAPEVQQARLQGYAGSVAFSDDGSRIGFTAPRGGVLHLFDVASHAFATAHEIADVCGLGAGPSGFFFTAGTGLTGRLGRGRPAGVAQAGCQWDNHLVPVA
ncbi:DUF1513 domain-containing protein [Ruegeria sp. 2012CJ41-6]|uniref:DUF1513 domain-containing protein n=1 Tax=Ruegeria spongiae TaxID=2942209 RepID=A0ABT0Q710_9RHOB|nr:DUF1513 domain-containing protein [Ruegeria spongiae]MCL6284938.1 DUF1513 domain-containing protein [Ruegeria spongiae]